MRCKLKPEEISLYQFLNLTKGCWRNSIYVKCSNCLFGKSNCSNHLLTVNIDGSPVFISVNKFQRLTNEIVVEDECISIIDRTDFEKLFNMWLIWNTDTSKECFILKLSI